MSLPKTPNSNLAKLQHLEALALPIGIVLIVLVVLVVGFIVPKKSQSNKETGTKKQLESLTTAKTIKNSEGKIQSVPPEVLQVTPEQLKTMQDNKQIVTLVAVVDGDGFNFSHIKGAEIINKKNFENSTASLDPSKTNVLISKDGLDSAIAITKLVNFGFNRQKTLNLKGGLAAWQAKGYSVEQ